MAVVAETNEMETPTTTTTVMVTMQKQGKKAVDRKENKAKEKTHTQVSEENRGNDTFLMLPKRTESEDNRRKHEFASWRGRVRSIGFQNE